MYYRNVVVTNTHLRTDNFRLWVSLAAEGVGFGETASVPNAFSAGLTSKRQCPQRHVKHGQDPNEDTSARAQGPLQKQASLRHLHSAPAGAGNETQVRRKARADIEGKAGKLIDDGAVYLFEAEVDMVLSRNLARALSVGPVMIVISKARWLKRL